MSFVLAGLLNACAPAVPIVDSYDTDSASLSRFQVIEILDDAAVEENRHRKLGAVQGLYCNQGYGTVAVDDPLATAQAIDQSN